MKKFYYIIIISCLFLFVPDSVEACATCFGDPSAPAAKGMNWAIITLLGVTGGVMGGVIGTIISIAKKTKNFQHMNKQ